MISLGTCSSGPATDIEQAMRRDGFDKTAPGGLFAPEGLFGGPTEHPFSRTGFGEISVPWTLQVTYSFSNRLAGSIILSHVGIGTTFGYATNPSRYLDLNYYSTVFSPQLIYHGGGILQVGAGPALFINRIEQEGDDSSVDEQEKAGPGVLLQAALLYPKHTRFFLKLSLQYRWTPEQTFGPFTVNSSRRLNPFTANFSHAYGGLGIGVHF